MGVWGGDISRALRGCEPLPSHCLLIVKKPIVCLLSVIEKVENDTVARRWPTRSMPRATFNVQNLVPLHLILALFKPA